MPFILDYQDLWVGAWGLTVGGGPNGKRDLKSQLTRTLAMRMEPYVAAAADAITAVSKETYEGIRARNPDLRQKLCEEIPLGGEPADFAYLRSVKKTNPYFDPNDGNFHLCYVGTLLPLGVETLGTFLRAVALLRDRRADLYAKLRLRFFGTSNQTRADASQRVLPMACNIGIADCVSEIAPRIDYLDALTVLTQATGILMMGSNEKHYTASKLYPGLLAKRPILAIYHQSSSVVNILGACACAPTARLVTYSDLDRVEDRQEAIYKELLALLENPYYDPAAVNTRELQEFSSEALAGKLAGVLDRVQKQ